MTEAGERPKHDPDDPRGGGGPGGGPGPDAQELWQKNLARARGDQDGDPQPEASSEPQPEASSAPPPEGDE